MLNSQSPNILDEELEFLSQLAEEHPKCYQIWHHRQELSELSGLKTNIEKELEFVKEQLNSDSKNYHCWSYYQYLIRTHSLKSLDLVNKYIASDIRNNSAWNMRKIPALKI